MSTPEISQNVRSRECGFKSWKSPGHPLVDTRTPMEDILTYGDVV